MEVVRAAACLIVKSMVLSARWAGRQRLHYLQSAAQAPGGVGELQAEIAFLRDRIDCLMSEHQLL